MSRLVNGGRSGIGVFSNDPEQDGYGDRVAKYIPAETLTAYVSIQALSGDKAPEPEGWWLPVFIALIVATVLYVRLLGKRSEKPWGMQAVIGVVAFILWSYALHDDDKFSPWSVIDKIGHDSFLAGILLILFTLFAGLIQPKKAGS